MSNTKACSVVQFDGVEGYITRYTIEYFACAEEDEDRLTDYVYADSYDEAMAVFEQKHGTGCLITMCEPIEVPARYKDYDVSASPSLVERMEAARRAAVEGRMNDESVCCGRSVVDYVKE